LPVEKPSSGPQWVHEIRLDGFRMAARTGEVIGARKSEIDLDAAVWTIPAERMKSARGHRRSRVWAEDKTDHPREIIEAALAHTIGDKAEQAYRRSDALDKRRALMNEWATFLMR
jgi:integrase